MAIGTGATFKIYNDQFYSGMLEEADQNLNVFNAASANTIILQSRLIRGNYEYESFLEDISGVVTRRDVTSVSAPGDLDWTQDEFVSVKINRKIGPVAKTLDSWKKIGQNADEFSFKMGQLAQREKMKDMINTALIAVEAAIQGQSALNFDATGLSPDTATHGHLVSALAKFGDASQKVRCWVGYSKPTHDLLAQAITDKITNVADVVIREGSTATLNRPLVVIDAPALHDANGSLADSYNWLGLVPGAVVVTEAEQETVAFELVTGLENLAYRYQHEYAYTIKVKGFRWDVTSGGANPTDGAVGTTTNWDKAATSDKSLAGVRAIFN